MGSRSWTTAIMALSLLLGTACTSVDDTGGSGDSVTVTIQASYEKRAYGSGGLGSVSTPPARFAFAQLCRTSDSQPIGQAIDLDINGRGAISIPRGSNVFAVVYADVTVPSGNDIAMQGSVLKASPNAHYTASEFKQLQDEFSWYVTSDSYVADSSGTVSLRALESTGEAGAFSIADQMVEFALGMQELEPALPLPNLHAFWKTGTQDNNPAPVTNTSGTIIRSSYSGRPVLAAEILYGSNWRTAAYNDSRLLETFARGLFASGSTWTATPGEEGSIVRGDNDNAFIDLGYASEPSIAFMSGFSHFLSCAIRDEASLYDAFVTDAYTTFRLDQRTGYSPEGGGEFYAGSVARSLWDIWKNVLGGGKSGLIQIWDATNPSLANQDLEFGKTPLACYPTYLRGLRRMASSVPDSTFMTALNRDNIGNGTDPISPTYLNGNTLWQRVTVPLSGSGTLTTHAASAAIYYDRNQARSYRFTFNGSGTLNATMTPTTGSQDFFLELIGPDGIVAASWDRPTGGAAVRTLSRSGLLPGEYVVRVRAGYTTSEYADAGYNLSIAVN